MPCLAESLSGWPVSMLTLPVNSTSAVTLSALNSTVKPASPRILLPRCGAHVTAEHLAFSSGGAFGGARVLAP